MFLWKVWRIPYQIHFLEKKLNDSLHILENQFIPHHYRKYLLLYWPKKVMIPHNYFAEESDSLSHCAISEIFESFPVIIFLWRIQMFINGFISLKKLHVVLPLFFRVPFQRPLIYIHIQHLQLYFYISGLFSHFMTFQNSK